MNNIESRIQALESRNVRVECDKAWEISWTRRISVLLITYVILSIYMMLLGLENWYLHAFVPTCGYFLSTLALPVIRKMWELLK